MPLYLAGAHCVVPEKNPYTPHGRSLEIPGGRVVLKAKFLEALYENKPEFPGRRGWGVQNQKPSMGGVLIFSGTVHFCMQIPRFSFWSQL